jgi:drug/metabolite transporter superfamily protein YnfA
MLSQSKIRWFREVFEVNSLLALLTLMAAAILEVCGDALVRQGLHSPGGGGRLALIALGGFTLLTYGIIVNLPSWDFGRLLGVYVACFFLVAQIVNYLGFRQTPSLPIWVGGCLIVTGGCLISFWRPS